MSTILFFEYIYILESIKKFRIFFFLHSIILLIYKI